MISAVMLKWSLMNVLFARIAGKVIGRSLMYSLISTDCALGNMMRRGFWRVVV